MLVKFKKPNNEAGEKILNWSFQKGNLVTGKANNFLNAALNL